MKYGIVENHKFILIDEDRQRLENTIPFMPKWKETDIAPYEDSEIEQGYDGAWYEKGHAPQRPLEEARTGGRYLALERVQPERKNWLNWKRLLIPHRGKRIAPHRSGSRSMPTKSPTAT